MGNDEVPDSSSGFVSMLVSELTDNPINLVLLVVCVYLLYRILKGRGDDAAPPDPDDSQPPLQKRDMTVEELRKYDGRQDDGRILMAVNGKVFDVTRGKNFYGPDGPYGVFAGRDASRGLAKFSLTEDVLKDGFDDLSDLSTMEMDTVREWDMQFTMKYDFIGHLIKSPEEEKSSKVEKQEDPEKPTDAEKKPLHPEQTLKVGDGKSGDGSERLRDAEKPHNNEPILSKIAEQKEAVKNELSLDTSKLSEEAKSVSDPVKPHDYQAPSDIAQQPSNDDTSSRDLLRDAWKNQK